MEVGILTFCNSSNCKTWHPLTPMVFSVCKHASIQAVDTASKPFVKPEVMHAMHAGGSNR